MYLKSCIRTGTDSHAKPNTLRFFWIKILFKHLTLSAYDSKTSLYFLSFTKTKDCVKAPSLSWHFKEHTGCKSFRTWRCEVECNIASWTVTRILSNDVIKWSINKQNASVCVLWPVLLSLGYVKECLRIRDATATIYGIIVGGQMLPIRLVKLLLSINIRCNFY